MSTYIFNYFNNISNCRFYKIFCIPPQQTNDTADRGRRRSPDRRVPDPPALRSAGLMPCQNPRGGVRFTVGAASKEVSPRDNRDDPGVVQGGADRRHHLQPLRDL